MTLIRHTRVAGLAGLCYGRTDVGVAETFAEEVAAVRAALAGVDGAEGGRRLVFTSPSQRCRRLAAELGAVDVRVDARLMELDFGAWENRAWADVPRTEIDAWARDYVRGAPPGGESFAALAERVAAFRAALPEEENVVVVTHAGVIRAWLCGEEGRPLERAFERDVMFGEVVRLGCR
ncbi:alpha-ribazole phosphatase family protein [Opitutus sp. ER46]|uniref:alpha-ribazole phosphatase family protein n=1 Tax=Opitutus sp. ER46 TaxID=2161864 RepID=UPI001304A4AA|nr:alpha-ribazole phosphatase family protein [Opitutus sp. ER46]